MKGDLLTINETAKKLKVSPNVIQEMIKDQVFSGIKKGNTIKIDKNEVDEWLAQLNEDEAQSLAMKRTVCRFQDYLFPENILLDFQADNKYEAIAKMAIHAKEQKIVRDHRWLYEVVVAREDLVSTAVGNNIALLHPRHHHPSKIKKPCVLFGRTRQGVEFDAPDEKPVNLLFMLLLHNDKQHLFSLSYISQITLQEENIKALNNAKTPVEVISILTKT